MKKVLIFSTVLISMQAIYAADDDTQLRLNQDLKQQQYQQEKQLLKDEDIGKTIKIPKLNINGQELETEQTPQQLAKNLYMAVIQKNWLNAITYLEQYKRTENYDQALVLFAEGALARAQGDLKQAEQKFKQTLVIQPNNLITELELARVLFERQKNKESLQHFKHVQEVINNDISNTIPKDILKSVEIFTQALEKRDDWQGSVSFGGLYTTNLNNSAEYIKTQNAYTIDEETGEMIEFQLTQKSPDPIKTTAIDYETTLSKRWSLSGNHGISFRGMSYGQIYNQQPDYNELTFNFNAGYSYNNEKNQILIAPVFENKYYAHDSLYNAYGLRGEWMRFVGNDKAVKIEGEVKDFNYKEYKDQNGLEYSTFVTAWKMLPKQWTLFGGLDYVDHNTEEGYIAAYQQEGIRLGLSKNFGSDFNATFSSSLRWRQFDKYTPVLGAKRDDFEQNYNLILTVPKWEFYGLTPNLSYQYNNNKSNVDWLYSYDKHKISLKLEHRF